MDSTKYNSILRVIYQNKHQKHFLKKETNKTKLFIVFTPFSFTSTVFASLSMAFCDLEHILFKVI